MGDSIMNENELLEEVCQEIKRDLDDMWNIKIKQNDKEIYKIIDKKKNDKLFIINSDKDFQIQNDKYTLIMYFDLNDNEINSNLNSIKLYVDNFLNKISENIGNDKTDKKILIYYFTNHYGKKVQVQNFYQMNSILHETDWLINIHAKINNIKLNDIPSKTNLDDTYSIAFKHLNYEKSTHKVLIDIESRVKRATTVSLTSEKNTVGEVYTASLYDLAKILGVMGDNLFKDNLRFKIDTDTTGVDGGIRNTLENSPQKFWYLNNGITIIVDKELISLKQSAKLMIEIDERSTISESHRLSVINGAQTLSVAADFFYNQRVKIKKSSEDVDTKQSKLEKALKAAIKEARVILRIIQVEAPKTEEIAPEHDWINRIAIALNSQKPIKKEDIVSTLYHTQAINSIFKNYKDDPYVYKIEKRGGQPSINRKSYLMTELAKVLVTYLEKKPGKARSSNSALISSTKNQETDRYTFNSSAFINQQLLINDMENDTGNVKSNNQFQDRVALYKYSTFDLFYRPVNFLMKVSSIIDDFRDKIESLPIKNDERDYSNLNELEGFNKGDIKIFTNTVDDIVSYGKYHLLLCIFENQLIEDGMFDGLYPNNYLTDLLKHSNIYMNEKDDEKNQESKINLLTLKAWSKTEEDAVSIVNEKFLISACIAFYKVWEKHRIKEKGEEIKSPDKEFKNDKNNTQYKNIVLDFNEELSV